MRQGLIDFGAYPISYQIGSSEVLACMQETFAMEPFADRVMNFLNDVARMLMADEEAKAYSDVITLAFWMRKASLENLRKRFARQEQSVYRLGRGIVFHIAPSNVPVNYAYSLATGLLCGNANVVRVPSKEFAQVDITNRALRKVMEEYRELMPYVALVKYGHDNAVNNALSAIADLRVVWGGDATIREIRKSPLNSRAAEITFADRYSLTVIDSDAYMEIDNKSKSAYDFYNDTYLTDQNACTSPRAVIWMGSRIDEAKELFWRELHGLLETKYQLQGVQAVDKLAKTFLLAAREENVKKVRSRDNLIVRMEVQRLCAEMLEFMGHSGFFLEYECKDILDLREICDNAKCQTISYIGDKEMLQPLIRSGVRGIDRVVPVGKTMDFDLLWDGYNLYERMTRTVVIS